MKTKDSKEMVRAFLTIITKKKLTEKNRVLKEKDFAGEFKQLCKAEITLFYSTKSETKAAIAERKIRSLKNKPYRYMEGNVDKSIHKLTHFLTTLIFRRNGSVDFILKNVRKFDFLTILYSKPLRENRNPRCKIGN